MTTVKDGMEPTGGGRGWNQPTNPPQISVTKTHRRWKPQPYTKWGKTWLQCSHPGYALRYLHERCFTVKILLAFRKLHVLQHPETPKFSSLQGEKHECAAIKGNSEQGKQSYYIFITITYHREAEAFSYDNHTHTKMVKCQKTDSREMRFERGEKQRSLHKSHLRTHLRLPLEKKKITADSFCCLFNINYQQPVKPILKELFFCAASLHASFPQRYPAQRGWQ